MFAYTNIQRLAISENAEHKFYMDSSAVENGIFGEKVGI